MGCDFERGSRFGISFTFAKKNILIPTCISLDAEIEGRDLVDDLQDEEIGKFFFRISFSFFDDKLWVQMKMIGNTKSNMRLNRKKKKR